MKHSQVILFFTVIVLFFSCGLPRKVEYSRGYYLTGEIQYEVKTVFYKHIDDFNSTGKKIVELREFQKDGRKLFIERKVFPAVNKEEHLSDMRHIMKRPYIRRKYTKYDLNEDIIEKHKLKKYDFYKTVKYNYDQHRRVIYKNNSKDIEGEINIKKKGNKEKSIRNKMIDPGYK